MSYACEWGDCSFVSDNFDTFYEHVRGHTTNFFCDLDDVNDDSEENDCQWRQCFSDSFENEPELIRHVLFHAYHANLKDLGLKAQTKAELAPCTLDPHARNLVPEFPEQFHCLWENCDVITSCPKYYYRHVDGHTGSTVKEWPHSKILCKWKDCTFTSTKRFKLKEHCRTHTNERCFSCPNCGGLFSNKTKFTDHLRRQNTMESESYQCSHCLKYCASERILRDHMRHHINNVKCSLCDMTCPTQSALQHHINFRHSEEKPYSCDMCETSFKMPNDLRRHQQTHSPIYSYTCEEEGCNYAAKALQSLRRHHKVWHESPVTEQGGRYECHICCVRYTRGTALTKHLKKQHTFRWPAGHKRFRYKEDNDGIYRLQTVRFESVELSQQLEASRKEQAISEEMTPDEDWEAPEESNHQELTNMTDQEYEDQLRVTSEKRRK
ncbi:Histone H4 transcription factor [Paramuricea clavata]|uniref:Histone H4 transcription factor n=1 Tax=Paramuricea clavata TaxID=317549 RepID=A0A6S7GP39_PARCT|nr:Histone H4 transcription factor [Paramuricea clavata]